VYEKRVLGGEGRNMKHRPHRKTKFRMCQKSEVIQSSFQCSLNWSVTLKYISYAIQATLIHTITARVFVNRLQTPPDVSIGELERLGRIGGSSWL